MKNSIRTLTRFLFAGCVCLLVLAPRHAVARDMTPEEYAEKVRDYFSEEQWEEGKRLLDEGLAKYDLASNLQYLMGKYWFHGQDYDKSRYYLLKAVDLNYDNVEAKQLLVDVEDITQNYSSAICFVNELLEVNPYWRGLWRRKIDLYRKQGNHVEADRLLKRINQIYPQDTVLHRDLVYSMELNYQRQKRAGDRKTAILTLEELLKSVPDNEQYYLDIINLHLQEGEQEQALAWTSRGLAALPGSVTLVYKKVGILSEMNRHPEALAFMRDRMRRRSTPELQRLYSTLVLDAARAERQRDPYVLYGTAFERGDHSREVVDYLLNTSMLRGYNDDALFYLREMRRYYGDDKPLLYKEYLIYRNMGEERQAFNRLTLLCERYPGDGELTDALCRMQLQRADRLMEQELYTEALPAAMFVTRQRTDVETLRAAWEKVLSCRIRMKRYDDAMATLDTLATRFPDTENLVGKRAYVLDRMGRTSEAMYLYLGAIGRADPQMRDFYVAGYADIAIPYIRQCLDEGATAHAFAEADQLLALDPSNDLALRYAINAAAQMGRDDVFREYTDRGLERHPREPFYLAKKAASLDAEGRYEASIELIRPVLWDYPGNPQLTGALSQSSEYRALDLTRRGRPDEALTVLDTALHYDARNKSLLYAKGLAYEKKKEYGLAYFYQQNYEPSAAEHYTFNRHLKGLRYGMLRNEIGLEYLQSRYGDEDAIQSVATLQYSRKQPGNTYTGRVNYAGRNGEREEDINANATSFDGGGVGVQLQGEWIHKFPRDWQTMVNLAWSDRYFPAWMANASLTKFFRRDWEAEARVGYRRLDGRNLWSVGPGVAKFLGPVWLNGKCDFFVIDSKFYYNAMAQVRYYPVDDGRSYVVGMAGIGSAPELSVLDRALPGPFDHANTMVGMGGQYMFTPNLTLGLLGTWYTYYTEKRLGYDTIQTRYKNMYNIYVQLYISF